MIAYIVRRLLLVVPTLFGIMLANFVIVQAAPGGPVEIMLARIRGEAVEATARVVGTAGGEARAGGREAREVTQERAGVYAGWLRRFPEQWMVVWRFWEE